MPDLDRNKKMTKVIKRVKGKNFHRLRNLNTNPILNMAQYLVKMYY